MKLVFLIAAALLFVGCATNPTPPADTKKSASIAAGDAVVAANEAAKSAEAAETKRAAAEKAVGGALESVGTEVFETKEKVSGLLVDGLQSLAAQKGDLEGIRTRAAAASQSAAAAKKQSTADQAELTRFRADDPVLKRITSAATWLMIGGVLVAIFGGIACAGLFASVPFLSALAGRAATWIVGIGLGMVGAGLALYMLADLLVSIRAAMRFAPLVLAGAAAAWALWHWGVARKVTDKIVATVDRAVATGAIKWTPEATAIANEIQGPITRAVVDSAQSAAVPAKPSTGAPA